jgi:hypothetical protein
MASNEAEGNRYGMLEKERQRAHVSRKLQRTLCSLTDVHLDTGRIPEGEGSFS